MDGSCTAKAHKFHKPTLDLEIDGRRRPPAEDFAQQDREDESLCRGRRPWLARAESTPESVAWPHIGHVADPLICCN